MFHIGASAFASAFAFAFGDRIHSPRTFLLVHSTPSVWQVGLASILFQIFFFLSFITLTFTFPSFIFLHLFFNKNINILLNRNNIYVPFFIFNQLLGEGKGFISPIFYYKPFFDNNIFIKILFNQDKYLSIRMFSLVKNRVSLFLY